MIFSVFAVQKCTFINTNYIKYRSPICRVVCYANQDQNSLRYHECNSQCYGKKSFFWFFLCFFKRYYTSVIFHFFRFLLLGEVKCHSETTSVIMKELPLSRILRQIVKTFPHPGTSIWWTDRYWWRKSGALHVSLDILKKVRWSLYYR